MRGRSSFAAGRRVRYDGFPAIKQEGTRRDRIGRAAKAVAEVLERRTLMTVSLQGVVWEDANANGVRDAVEKGLAAVTVELRDAAGLSVGSTVTASDGVYRFDGLLEGAPYRVGVAAPSAFTFTARDVGSNDELDSDIDPTTGLSDLFIPTTDGTRRPADAGLAPVTLVGGVAYRDINGDGKFDRDEPGLDHWTVFVDADGDDLLDPGETSILTNSSGAYTFPLTPGAHRIASAPPAGWKTSTPAAARTVVIQGGVRGPDVSIGHVAAGPQLEVTPVGPRHRANPLGFGAAVVTAVASNSRGDSVVVWDGASIDGTTIQVFGQLYDPTGAPRGDFFTVAEGAEPNDLPTVAMNADGGFFVAWRRSNTQIVARRFSADATPVGETFAVNTSGVGVSPLAAANPAGGFAVVWRGGEEIIPNKVLMRRFKADGSPEGPQVQVNDQPSYAERLSGFAFDPSGGSAVVYAKNGEDDVHVRRYDAAGQPMGPSFLASTYASSGRIGGSVAYNPSGASLIVWRGAQGVYGQFFKPDGSRSGGEFRISSTPFVNADLRPAVAANADGQFLVTWLFDGRSDRAGLYAQVVSAQGAPVGREFRMADASDGKYDLVGVSGGGSGGFVVNWISRIRNTAFVQRLETFEEGAAVGDFVWDDRDVDGVQDLGEPGVPGVVVELYNVDGAFADSTVTDAAGQYHLQTLKPGAAYRVRFLAPQGKTFSPIDRGGDDAADSDADRETGFSAAFVAGVPNLKVDAGLTLAGSIAGTVFEDLDGDGALDAGENGLAEWEVLLDENSNGRPDPGESVRRTSFDGAYAFDRLPRGVYRVVVDPYLRWTSTTSAASLSVNLASGVKVTGVNAGFRPAAPDGARAAAEGPEIPINAQTSGDQLDAATSRDRLGNTVVVWLSDADGVRSVRARRYDATGAPLSGEFQVGVAAGTGAPKVAMAADGDFVVVWPSPEGVRARRFHASGDAAGDEIRIGSDFPVLNRSVDVAMADDGRFVVVWAAGDGSGTGVFAQVFAKDGAPVGAATRLNAETRRDQSQPAVALRDDGSFVATWLTDMGAGSKSVVARRFTPTGEPLGAELIVAAPSTVAYDQPDVDVNDSGEFVIAYTGADDSESGVLARRYDASGRAQGGTILLNRQTAFRQEAPAVAIENDGSFIVAWEGFDGVATDIYVQLFDGVGRPIGRRLTASHSAAARQTRPAIAADADGFFVAWTSYDQDGDGAGVFGQRFVVFDHAASVGGIVFVDNDDDGVKNADDFGLFGARLQLLDAWGRVIDETQTDGMGIYRFIDLRPGVEHRVQLADSVDVIYSRPRVGSDPEADSDVDPATGATFPFSVAPDAADLTRGVGLVPLGGFSGIKFFDLDGDGVRDPDETGLSGWTIFLDADGDGQFDEGESTTTTDEQGRYHFSGLRPGVYHPTEVTLTHWAPTASNGSVAVRLRGELDLPGADLGGRPTAPVFRVEPVGPETAAPADGPFGPGLPPYHSRPTDYFKADLAGAFVTVGVVDEGNGNGLGVVAKRFTAAGDLIGAPIAVNTTVAGHQYFPSIAMTPGGAFVVAWVSDIDADGNNSLLVRRFDRNGAPLSGEIHVNGVSAAGVPTTAISADGAFVVVWHAGEDVYARRFNAAGEAQGDVFQINDSTAGLHLDPVVAMDAAGNFIVVWRRIPNPMEEVSVQVLSRRFNSNGVALGGDAVVVDDVADMHSVAMNDAGEFVVAWTTFSMPDPPTFVARYDANGVRQGGPIRVTDRARSFYPQVGIDASGAFAVAFQNADSDENGIHVRRFTASGVAIGNESRVNTVVQGDQTRPQVSFSPNGGFSVGWRDADSRVHSQRFEPATAGDALVGGVVWEDINGDGIFDLGEPTGYPGGDVERVAVELLNEAGAYIERTSVRRDGTFEFAQVTPGRRYTLQFILPTGKVATRPNQGGDDGRDSDVDPASPRVALTAPQAGLEDRRTGLGLVPPSGFTGVKFNDLNANGVQDFGERGLAGWTLFLDDDNDGRLDPGERFVVTGSEGSFEFLNLLHGVVRLREIPQLDWRSTRPDAPVVLDLGPGEGGHVAWGSHTDVPDFRPIAGGEFFADAGDAEVAGRPRVAIREDGSHVVTWTSRTAAGMKLLARRFAADGRPLGQEMVVDVGGENSLRFPTVAYDAEGRFVVAWERYPTQNEADVFAQRFTATGERAGAIFKVNQSSESFQIEPSIVMRPDGSFLIAWRQNGGPLGGVWCRRYDAAGTPLGDERQLISSLTYDYSIGDGKGNGFVLAWTMPVDSVAATFAQPFDDAGKPSAEAVRLSGPSGGFANAPTVGVDAQGNFVAAWIESRGITTLRVDRFGVPQGAPKSTGYSGSSLGIAASDDGSYVITWHEYVNGGEIPFAVAYNAVGVEQSPGWSGVNIPFGGSVSPAVALNSRGDFVIAWMQSSQSTSRIAGRRFHIDHAPTTTGLPDVVVDVGAPDTAVDLFAAFADDHDPDQRLTFSIVDGGDPSLFAASIDQFAGVLRLRYSPTARGVSVVRVRATDSRGLSVESAFAVTVGPALRVTDVFVAGSTWSESFRRRLSDAGDGDAILGHRMADLGPGVPLPWVNLDRISVRFSADVFVKAGDLLLPSDSTLRLTGFRYDIATHTATWNFSTPLPQGRMKLRIARGVQSVNGDELGDGGVFELAILPGDVDRSGVVNSPDLVQIRNRVGRGAADSAIGLNAYTVFHDINGDGVVNATDLVLVRNRIGTALTAFVPRKVQPSR